MSNTILGQVIEILMIEDNPENAYLLEVMLEHSVSQKFNISHVEDLNHACLELDQKTFDLVLVDLSLPDSSGLDTLIEVHRHSPNIPLIVLTGISSEEVALKALQIGAQDYLVKGQLDKNVLIRSIRYAIERKRIEVALAQERALLARRVEERTADLRAVNAELARSARLKDEFLANMSHELRTPLSAILGLAEALQREVYGELNEKQLKSLIIIEESGQHLLSLINDILDIAKLEAGKLELEIGSVFAEIVSQASVRMIEQTAHEKQIKVKTSFKDDALTNIQADERAIKQILVNLLSNAVKFTPEKGEIGLDILINGEEEIIQIKIWDKGIGIADEDMKHLFQPFVQIDSKLSRQYAGTGLGLALVSRLVMLHGGGIAVDSKINEGSCFTLTLPMAGPGFVDDLGDAEGNQTQAVSLHKPIKGRTVSFSHNGQASVEAPLVLLIDDNESVINVLVGYLVAEGYQVMVLREGITALEHARNHQPALLFLDINLSGLGGIDAINQLRAELHQVKTPIIALTGIILPGDEARCLAAGASVYLGKPINLNNLTLALETCFEGQKLLPKMDF